MLAEVLAYLEVAEKLVVRERDENKKLLLAHAFHRVSPEKGTFLVPYPTNSTEFGIFVFKKRRFYAKTRRCQEENSWLSSSRSSFSPSPNIRT